MSQTPIPLDTADLDELERLEREAAAAWERCVNENSPVLDGAYVRAVQRFHDKLQENPEGLLSLARLGMKAQAFLREHGSTIELALEPVARRTLKELRALAPPPAGSTK